MTDRPLPVPDNETSPFWGGTRAGEIRLRCCADCNYAMFYPRLICPECGSDNLIWKAARGHGTIYSVTVVHRAPAAFRDLVPYAVAMIELEEGPRMMSRLLTNTPDDVAIGDKVQVHFENQNDEISLPHFKLEKDANTK